MAQMVKNLPVMRETQVGSLGQEDPLEKEQLPTPVFLAKFHEQRRLTGYSPYNGQSRSIHWAAAAAAAAKSLQSCPTLCDPIDGSPPGSPVPGTLQARTLEWVAISFSNA